MKYKSLKILLIEDNPADAELLQFQLRKNFPGSVIQVVICEEEYNQALVVFQPDIILSDNALPQFSGAEALAIRNENYPMVPFILVTGTVSEEFAAGIIKAGADDYLLKDRLTRLPAAMEAALKQKQTEKEKIEVVEQLKESEEKYRTILERVTDAFAAVDANGIYTYVNYKAGEILDKDPRDMIGRNIWEVFPGSVDMPFYEAYNKAFNLQTYQHVENYYGVLDSWIENHFYPSSEGISIIFRDITERKKSEQLIKQANERFEIISLATNDAVYEYDIVNQTGWYNKAFKDLFVDPDDLRFEAPVVDAWRERLHPDDRDRVIEGLHKTYNETALTWTDEFRFRKSDGSYGYFYDRAYIVRDDNGKPTRLIGSMIDISALKKAEEKLHANEKRFRKLVENGNDAFVILPVQGKPLYVSSSVERVLGYTEAEVMEMDMFDLVHPDHIEEVQETLKQVMENPGVPVTGHISRLMHKDGTWHWFEDTITNLLDDPDIGGIVDNFRDVTERVNGQLAIKESEDKYRDIFENISDILFSHDSEGHILSANPAVANSLGYELADLLKLNIRDILTAESNEKFAYYMYLLNKNGFANGQIYVQTSKGEKRVWEYRNTLRTTGVKKALIRGFASDVTERKKAQKQLMLSEKRFRALVENNDGIISVLNKDLVTIFRSESTCRITGYTHKEIEDAGNKMFIHPEDAVSVETVIKKSLLKPGIPLPLLFRALHKNGHYIWLEGVITNMIQDVSVGGIVTNLRDVTIRRQTEAALKEERDKFGIIAETAPGLIYSFRQDKEGKFSFPYASNAIEEIFGYKEEEVKSDATAVFNHGHIDDFEAVIASIAYSAVSMLPWKHEFRYIHPVKGEIWLEGNSKPMAEPGGTIIWHGIITDITERRKTEAAKKESDEQYRILVEQASDGIFIADNSGKFIMVNSSGSRLSGFSLDELKAMTIFDLVDPKELASNPFHFEEMKQPQGARSERKMICKDGRVMEVEISAKYLSDSRFIAFVRDISERIKAENAIRASEEKYRVLVEQASEAIFIANPEGRFLMVNAAACKISQYSEAELLTMKFYDFFIEEDIKVNPLKFDDLYLGKTIVSERVMKRKDGGVNYLELTAKILTDGRLLALVRDVAERKKAQDALLNEKNLSDSIINSLPGIFYLCTQDGRLLRWNKNLEKVTHYLDDEISSMYALDFFDDEDKKLVSNAIKNVFSNGEANVQANYKLKSGGKIPYYFTGIAVEYEGNTCLMGLGVDFSEKIKAQEKIKQTTEQLRELTSHLQSVREEERKRIAREIHDELGQQLTAIKMDISWINKKIPEDSSLLKSKMENVLALINGSNQSIRRILSELRPGILDNNGLLEALEWQNHQFTSNTGIPVEFNSSETELKLPDEMATCIFRVCQEAFTNITRYAAASHVGVSLAVEAGKLRFKIADDGIGFDPAKVSDKKSFGILGMKERVVSLGGDFNFDSAPGKGTRIHFSLNL